MIRRFSSPGLHGIGGIALAELAIRSRSGPITLLLQPDAVSGIDTAVFSTAATFNYGTQKSFLNTATNRALVRFDLSAIPTSAECLSATLFLYHAATAGALAFTVSAYSIAVGNAAWIEGTKAAALAGAGEPCWNALAADGLGGVLTAWAGSAGLSTAGTDYENGAIGSFSGNRADAVGVEYSMALTPGRVRDWFGSPNTNYGMLLITSAATAGIATSDHATAGYRPKLVVVYQVA